MCVGSTLQRCCDVDPVLLCCFNDLYYGEPYCRHCVVTIKHTSVACLTIALHCDSTEPHRSEGVRLLQAASTHGISWCRVSDVFGGVAGMQHQIAPNSYLGLQ